MIRTTILMDAINPAPETPYADTVAAATDEEARAIRDMVMTLCYMERQPLGVRAALLGPQSIIGKRLAR